MILGVVQMYLCGELLGAQFMLFQQLLGVSYTFNQQTDYGMC